MQSIILNLPFALTAWGMFAGMRTASPCERSKGVPPIVMVAPPSRMVTNASNGTVCSLTPLRGLEAKISYFQPSEARRPAILQGGPLQKGL